MNEESLVADFTGILSETGADPARLLLEITETSLMADVETNLRVLRRLADLGLRVAVDDFGTGYSSLAQLTRLPVNVLKIDRAFVDGLDKSEESRTIIRAVIGLGRALGLSLVAEGVENGAQQRELCAYGCNFIQGYYFHRPVEQQAFVEIIERGTAGSLPGTQSPLHFIIYVSHTTRQMSAEELVSLQQQARAFNRSAGISGCLVHKDGFFMQMIEGERAALFSLLEKIKADPRHRDLRIVVEGPARRRVFSDSGMVLRDLAQDPDAADFEQWQRRSISFFDLAEDARTCFEFVTAYA